MRIRRDQFVLGVAFAAALVLHAAVLPLLGAAVSGEASGPRIDVVVSLLDAPRYAQARSQIRVSAQVIEYRDGEPVNPAAHTRSDRLLLSRDRLADADDVILFHREMKGTDQGPVVTATSPPAPTLPADADGPYWLIYLADADEQVPDDDRANNTRIKPIYIDGPQQPELSIVRFEAPGVVTSGGGVLADYEVENVGEGWAANPASFVALQEESQQGRSPQWADRVYLSRDESLDAGDLALRSFDRVAARSFDRTEPLKPAGTYHHDGVELAIPRGLTGRMYLIAVADADQELDQPGFTAGLYVQPILLVDSATPDLVVASIDQPDPLVVGRPTPVTFSVANLGSAATDSAAWRDGLYLSKTPELNDAAIPLGLANADQPLQPLSRYESTVDVVVPESVEPGEWFLIVSADTSQAIDEETFEFNNARAVPVVVMSQEQADEEVALGERDRPDRIVVQWIEYERIEEHVARLSRTVQPAVQARVDPTPNAPAINDATPPADQGDQTLAAGNPDRPQEQVDPLAQTDAPPQPTAPDASQTDVPVQNQQLGSPTPQQIDGLAGTDGDANPIRDGITQPTDPADPQPIDPTPSDQLTPSLNPGERDLQSTPDPLAPQTDRTTQSLTPSDLETGTDSDNEEENDARDPAEQPQPTEAQQQTENPDATLPTENDGSGDTQQQTDDPTSDETTQDPATEPQGDAAQTTSPSEPENPTRTPRSRSEAPPVDTRRIEVRLQEGRVLVGEGISVRTVLPTVPGTSSRLTTLPRNARVRLTFNRQGEVYEARVIRSTNYQSWDQAIESSLYRWRAEGDAVDELEEDQYIIIEWNYIMNDRPGPGRSNDDDDD